MVAAACSAEPGFPAFGGRTWSDLADALADEEQFNEATDRPVLQAFLATVGMDWEHDWLPLLQLSSTATGACHQGRSISWREALAELRAGNIRVPASVSRAKQPLKAAVDRQKGEVLNCICKEFNGHKLKAVTHGPSPPRCQSVPPPRRSPPDSVCNQPPAWHAISSWPPPAICRAYAPSPLVVLEAWNGCLTHGADHCCL